MSKERTTPAALEMRNLDSRLARRFRLAAHESPQTTKLSDRTGDEITLDEVEQIRMPNALITSALSVAVGLVVYGAAQFAQRFWLDPVTDLMKALGRAAYACVYYAIVYSSPGVVRPELTQESSTPGRKRID